MAEPIGLKFCVGPCITTGDVNRLGLQKFVYISFWLLRNFENSRKNIWKSENFYKLLF